MASPSFNNDILLAGLSEGNQRIFDYIFATYYSGLVAFGVKLGARTDEAEDIVQDIFMNLWLARKSLEIKVTVKTYLFTSVANRTLNLLRHRKVKEKTSEIIENIYYPKYTERDFLTEQELKSQLQAAIGNLPEKCRRIFEMYRRDGKTTAEIAQAEGISVRTVEGHIGKAYKLLRTELSDIFPMYIIAMMFAQHF